MQRIPVCLVVAMETEMAAITCGWNTEPVTTAAEKQGAPFRYARTLDFEGLEVFLAKNGRDPVHGCDNIGLEPAALNTWNAIRELHPRFILSVGTCGSFARVGSKVGDVLLGHKFCFHDHRIPLDPFRSYGDSLIAGADVSSLGKALGLRVGTVSSGSSLAYTKEDLESLEASGALAKEMEAAAMARVCTWFRIPFFAVKAVTNVLDITPDSSSAFVQGFEAATAALHREVPRVLRSLRQHLLK